MKSIDRRAKAKRAALKALQRAKQAAEMADIKLTDWEGEFLGSVEERVETYGRAFRDPEKGPADASLSLRQTVKLKEIAAKTDRKPGHGMHKSGFKRRKGFAKSPASPHGGGR